MDNIKNKKIKIICLLTIILLISIYTSFYKKKINIDYNIIKTNKEYNDLFVTAIQYYDSYLCYDKNMNIYYTNDNKINLEKIKIISPYKSKYYYEKIDDTKYHIIIYNNKLYKETTLKIVDIPLISINSFSEMKNISKIENTDKKLSIQNEKQNTDTKVYFQLLDNKNYQHGIKSNQESSIGTMNIRGATSIFFPKKAYRINLDQGKSLLGMPSDKDWILDALYTDESKIRNKLSSDIWNKINDNQTINNDLYGQFVEVFIDNNYNGLYVLKEKVNKKRLNISKNGILAKSISHVDDNIRLRFMYEKPEEIFKYDEKTFGNFEIKYYTDNSLYTFYNRLSNLYFYKSNYDMLNNYFEMNNYLNYKIFLMLINGIDNYSKNQYLSMKDNNSKIFITPWDMDLTWGLFSSGNNELLSSKDYLSYSDPVLIYQITSNIDQETLQLLKKRYWELRKNVITIDTINNYLDSYKKQLIDSGATQRDSEKWYEYDVEFEIEQIRTWATYRIQFLDNCFK